MSSDQLTGDCPASSTQLFDDGYLGYNPRLSSQRFDSFSNFAESDSVKEPAGDDSPIFTEPIYVSGGGTGSGTYEFSSLTAEVNETSNGPILPPPVEMQPEEGFALREWRRLNTIRLEEKEKREKEVLSQIVDEADEFKVEFYRKREVTVETNKGTNREKEKLFTASHEKFYAEAANNYWKSIGELIPNEVPTIERKGKRDEEKKPSVVVIHGPKPGKPTDLLRMRQILLKLKHKTPPHLKPSPPTGPPETTDSATSPVSAAVATSSEPLAVA